MFSNRRTTKVWIVVSLHPANARLTPGKTPQVHLTKRDATFEAERLAALNSGTQFIVFEAVSTSLASTSTTTPLA